MPACAWFELPSWRAALSRISGAYGGLDPNVTPESEGAPQFDAKSLFLLTVGGYEAANGPTNSKTDMGDPYECIPGVDVSV
jgi:hypothetical protein